MAQRSKDQKRREYEKKVMVIIINCMDGMWMAICSSDSHMIHFILFVVIFYVLGIVATLTGCAEIGRRAAYGIKKRK